MNIITDNKSLALFCKSLKTQKFVTLDTEFVRERTFYPFLCLIQVATPRKSAVIDVLADITDYSPLIDVLTAQNVVKVFHSARQDIEAIYCLLKVMPSPVFDTQVGAMALGFGDSVSYQCLVQHFCKVTLDKGQRLTDWTKRPLNEAQVNYAVCDVTYLVKVYREITKKLTSLKREEWIKEEEASLLDEDNYVIKPEKAWERLKLKSLSMDYLARLKEIAALRETIAINSNKPRKYIMTDDVVSEIALLNPKNTDDLASIRGITKRSDGSVKYADEIFAALAKADVSSVEIPKMPSRDFNTKLLKRKPLVEMLRLLLSIKCSENNVSPKLVASHSDIDDIAVYGEKGTNKALKGWRLDFYGNDALSMCTGKLTISYDNVKNKIVTDLKL